MSDEELKHRYICFMVLDEYEIQDLKYNLSVKVKHGDKNITFQSADEKIKFFEMPFEDLLQILSNFPIRYEMHAQVYKNPCREFSEK